MTLVTIDEVARLLHYSTKTVYRRRLEAKFRLFD